MTSARERHDVVGALREANERLEMRLANQTDAMDEAAKALKAAISHITELERDIVIKDRVIAELAKINGERGRHGD